MKKKNTQTAKSAVAEKNAKRAVTFSFPGSSDQKVLVAGSFNDWQERPLTFKNGRFSLKVMLAPGEYQYKFLVNGEWHLDDANPNFTPNGFGTLNSVLVVKEK